MKKHTTHGTFYRAKFFLFLCTMYLSIFMLYDTQTKIHLRNRALDTDNGFFYFTIQHETNPLELSSNQTTLNRFSSLYQDLNHSKAFEYYEIYKQPLYIQDTRLNCAQVSENVLDDFEIVIAYGRSFNAEDFLLDQNEHIPILLGHSLSGYELGDVFKANYLYQDYTFEVIGFLKSDSKIARSNGTIYLDSYMVMPSVFFQYKPDTETEYVSQLIHSANKVSGKVKVLPENYNQMKSYVLPLLENSNLGEFSWYSSAAAEETLIPLNIQRNYYCLLFFINLILCISFVRSNKNGFLFSLTSSPYLSVIICSFLCSVSFAHSLTDIRVLPLIKLGCVISVPLWYICRKQQCCPLNRKHWKHRQRHISHI